MSINQVDGNTTEITTTMELNLLGGSLKKTLSLTDVFKHDGIGTESYELGLYSNTVLTNGRLSTAIEESLDDLEALTEKIKAKGLVQVVNLTALGSSPAAGAAVAGSGAGAVTSALNGGALDTGAWIKLPSRFAGQAPIESPSLDTVSKQEMKDICHEYLTSLGLNPEYFLIWDNRETPEQPTGSIVNINVAKDHKNKLTGKLAGKTTAYRVLRWNKARNAPEFAPSGPEWDMITDLAPGQAFMLDS